MGKLKEYTAEEVAQMWALYDGHTQNLETIGRRFHCSAPKVADCLKAAGHSLRGRGRPPKGRSGEDRNHGMGEVLRDARVGRKFTSLELAARSGLVASCISHVENGEGFSFHSLKQIADGLGLKVSTLVRRWEQQQEGAE